MGSIFGIDNLQVVQRFERGYLAKGKKRINGEKAESS